MSQYRALIHPVINIFTLPDTFSPFPPLDHPESLWQTSNGPGHNCFKSEEL